MSAFAPAAFPANPQVVFWICAAISLVAFAAMLWAVFHKETPIVPDETKKLTGLEVEHDGDGTAWEINHGREATEGVVINAAPVAGHDVRGAHVTKRGTGAALVVNQLGGSGAALRINVGTRGD